MTDKPQPETAREPLHLTMGTAQGRMPCPPTHLLGRASAAASLRFYADRYEANDDGIRARWDLAVHLLRHAADEIERLRAEVANG